MLQIFIIILFQISPKSYHYAFIIPKMNSLFSNHSHLLQKDNQLLQFIAFRRMFTEKLSFSWQDA